MKNCSLYSFLKELNPWLSKRYIHKAEYTEGGQFLVHFYDGTKNVYKIDDCSKSQLSKLFSNLQEEGISIELS